MGAPDCEQEGGLVPPSKVPFGVVGWDKQG